MHPVLFVMPKRAEHRFKPPRLMRLADELRCALEKRETIEILLLKIEAYDVIAHARDKRIKKFIV